MPLRPGDPAYWPEHSCHDGCPCQRHDTEPPDTERDIPPPEPSQQGGYVLPRRPEEPDGWGLYHDRVHVEPGNARPVRVGRVPS